MTPAGWAGLNLPGLVKHLVVARLPFAAPNLVEDDLLRALLAARGMGGREIDGILMGRRMEETRRRLRQGLGRAIRAPKDAATVWIGDPRFPLPDVLVRDRRARVSQGLAAPFTSFIATIPVRFREEDAAGLGRGGDSWRGSEWVLTILTNAPESLVQRTRHSRDDGVVVTGEKVQLADRSGLVVGHAVVGGVEDGELTLKGFEAIPEDGRYRISTGLTLDACVDAWVDGGATAERAVRPEQAAFRRLLLAAYEGRCALTECDVEGALEAAHLRPWQVANKASDGILLRRDVHALLDKGLMTIDRNFRVRFVPKAVGYYGEFEGRMLRPPKRKADWPQL